MSTTKITIVVLILVALLFVVFVTKGALREDKPSDKKAPSWTKVIKGVSSYRLFRSMQPKADLRTKRCSSSCEEKIPADENPTHKFRIATFRLDRGSASIEYTDLTEDAGRLKDQPCPLPNFDSDDFTRCSIVVLKRGGVLKINCLPTSPCLVEVE